LAADGDVSADSGSVRQFRGTGVTEREQISLAQFGSQFGYALRGSRADNCYARNLCLDHGCPIGDASSSKISEAACLARSSAPLGRNTSHINMGLAASMEVETNSFS